LQARRKVGRLADDAALLRFARSDQVADHNDAGCNANSGLKRSAGLECGNHRDQLQPREHRLLGIIFMRPRVTEVDEHTIAHIFRHEAAETAHGLGDGFLIDRNDLPQIFRIHAGGESCRTDQIAEHDGDLATLGGIEHWNGRCSEAVDRRCARLTRLQAGNRTQDLTAMA
jgi:hypothetical protein